MAIESGTSAPESHTMFGTAVASAPFLKRKERYDRDGHRKDTQCHRNRQSQR